MLTISKTPLGSFLIVFGQTVSLCVPGRNFVKYKAASELRRLEGSNLLRKGFNNGERALETRLLLCNEIKILHGTF